MSTRNRSLPGWLIPVVVIVVAAALIFVVLTGPGGDESEQPVNAAPSGQNPPTEIQGPADPDFSVVEQRDESDLLTLGPIDAPVVLVAFSDFQCPFCGRWSEQTLPTMVEYAEAGDLRIEWRDLAIFGEESGRAALAAYAAAEQGQYWEYHNALFPGGETRPPAALTEEALISLAAELGLNIAQFEADMKSTETLETVSAHQQMATDLGVFSTPTFLINGQPITGAQPTQVFVDAVDMALELAG